MNQVLIYKTFICKMLHHNLVGRCSVLGVEIWDQIRFGDEVGDKHGY